MNILMKIGLVLIFWSVWFALHAVLGASIVAGY
jgi:hypothetical protein